MNNKLITCSNNSNVIKKEEERIRKYIEIFSRKKIIY